MLAFGLAVTPWTAAAADGGGQTKALSADELVKVLDLAKAKGVQVLVVSPGAEPAAGEAQKAPSFSDRLARLPATWATFRERLGTLLDKTSGLPEHVRARLAAAERAPGADSLAVVFLGTSTLLLLAWFAESLVRNRFAGGRGAPTTPPTDGTAKMALLFSRFIGRAIGIVASCSVVLVLVAIVFSSDHLSVVTALLLIGAFAAMRLLAEFWRIWLSPYQPELRIPAMSDAAAKRFFFWLLVNTVFMFSAIAFAAWMRRLGVGQDFYTLAALYITAFLFLFNITLILRNRHAVSGAFSQVSRPGQSVAAPLRTFFVGNWAGLLGFYLLCAWLTTVVRLVMGWPNALGLMGSMLLVLVGSTAVYGAGTILLERLFARRRGVSPQDASSANATPLDVEAVAPSGTAALQSIAPRTYLDLARQALAIFVLFFAALILLAFWGFGVFKIDGPLSRLWDIGLVISAGYLAYEAAKIAVGRRIAEEDDDADVPSGVEGGAGSSRLTTLLPLFRSFILITIIAVTAMMVLSRMGVAMAPLFAGAGVVGFALGFGAQTLVRDVFSGAFFLSDDAFRKGETVAIGDLRGRVERINIRSLQVRHLTGALHTIPFGEIKYLTNYSRDWAVLRLEVRLPFDTDETKVRMLIKKLGKELAADPEIGPLFLAPLKSQGVVKMDDSAMVMRVKFKTRPGDQWSLRRHVYARIRELFAKEGIKFASREVVVRLADEDAARPLDQAVKTQIAGAVLPTIVRD
jgi:small-conductance mechanosensitive channel